MCKVMDRKVPVERSRKVRCGIIGAGWWATYAHIPALLEHPNAELVAIQKRNVDEALKVARYFGIPRACTSAEALITENQIDAVVVASSPNMHYEHARLALREGLHVLVEKPMTLRAAEARELVSLAAENGRQLIISCPWHYTRHGQDAQRLISTSQLGDVRMISVLMTNPVADLIRGASRGPIWNRARAPIATPGLPAAGKFTLRSHTQPRT
jgi:predicted dehydrogenase